MAGYSPEAEGGQQVGRHAGQIKEDTDRSSGEPWRTLHRVNSVHLSFPSKAVEQWSGTFGSHVLFLFGQWWEGQEGLSKCVPMCTAMYVAL